MSLAIRSQVRSSGSTSGGDSFLERVSKFVPIEVMTLLLVEVTFAPPTTWRGWSFIAVGAGAVMAPVALYWDAARRGASVSPVQYVIRSMVLVGWAVALSEPFAEAIRVDARIAVASVLLLPLLGERIVSRGLP